MLSHHDMYVLFLVSDTSTKIDQPNVKLSMEQSVQVNYDTAHCNIVDIHKAWSKLRFVTAVYTTATFQHCKVQGMAHHDSGSSISGVEWLHCIS